MESPATFVDEVDVELDVELVEADEVGCSELFVFFDVPVKKSNKQTN